MNDIGMPIPEYMTVNAGYEERALPGEGHIIRGRPLSYRMLRYLTRRMAGKAREDRLLQMEEINEPVHATYSLRQQGWTVEQIADWEGLSTWAVYKRLKRAEEFMSGHLNPANDEERLRNLDLRRPRAFAVRVLMAYGWSQEQLAVQFRCSVRSIQRDAAAARAALGEVPSWKVREYAERMEALDPRGFQKLSG